MGSCGAERPGRLLAGAAAGAGVGAGVGVAAGAEPVAAAQPAATRARLPVPSWATKSRRDAWTVVGSELDMARVGEGCTANL